MHAVATPRRSQKLDEQKTAANKRFRVIRAQLRRVATDCSDWFLIVGLAGHQNVC